MKRIIKHFALVVLFFAALGTVVSAEIVDPSVEIDRYLAGEEIKRIQENIPSQAADIMDNRGISSFTDLISMPAEDLWHLLLDEFKGSVQEPLQVLVSPGRSTAVRSCQRDRQLHGGRRTSGF